MFPAWLAAPLARWGGKLLTGIVVAGGIAAGLLGIRRAIRKDAKREVRLEDDLDLSHAALDKAREDAEVARAMEEARADGPHSPADIAKRLRDGDA